VTTCRQRYRSGLRRWSVAAAGAALATYASEGQAQEWTKHFRIGMQLTLGIEAEFSMSGSFSVPFQPGIYDDGYVLDDDLNAPVDGVPVTTHWGYNSASQFNVEGLPENTLAFHRIDSFDAGSTRTTEKDPVNYGLEVAYGGPIHGWRHALLGWEVGYSMLPIRISDTRPLLARVFQIEDVYDTAPTGIPIILPEPPYQGGPSGVEQPIIGREPTGDSGGEEFDGTITGRRTLDLTLHNFRFGPTFHYEFARRWAMQVGAGGALGFVDGEYKFRETVTPVEGASRGNKGDIGASELVYGGYVNGLVLFHVEDHGDIYAGLQFMSLSDSEINGEGRSAKLKMSGAFSFLIGVNWPF
jgi:hypothetical protein